MTLWLHIPMCLGHFSVINPEIIYHYGATCVVFETASLSNARHVKTKSLCMFTYLEFYMTTTLEPCYILYSHACIIVRSAFLVSQVYNVFSRYILSPKVSLAVFMLYSSFIDFNYVVSTLNISLAQQSHRYYLSLVPILDWGDILYSLWVCPFS